ncbi:NUDIX hydrolase [Couchioplanes caeruleus]|uniref:NUDIX hydrolase n=2 Tax=Couchioplanes caeruleus TaxID=56438 RepID=A0A1K0GHP5_9ACTN|nr:NUDIX domain-containing protein [Couchioplanes caeruleus]OJF10444.1 NUDIX hydrolase [Couchioplanes caeruleus subsp. caeruleus]ROP32514.1 ADP-ribose pyrophosphatase YjhB (NUDIX family) [Couchioplanes caeruleus]
MTYIERRAARVLLVDAGERVLLLHGGDPARPGLRWWFTPGGGLDEGETPAQGAARELFEETGLRLDPAELGEPVHHEVTEFSYDGRQYRQDQHFFLHRVPAWEVDFAGFDAQERQTITEHRWWTLTEIDGTDAEIYPPGLTGLLRRCLALARGH